MGYTKGYLLDESGLQKYRFLMRVVYKRICSRQEYFAKGSVLDESGVHKDWF